MSLALAQTSVCRAGQSTRVNTSAEESIEHVIGSVTPGSFQVLYSPYGTASSTSNAVRT